MDPGDSDILTLLATDLRHSYERLVSTYWYRLKVFVLSRTGSPQDGAGGVRTGLLCPLALPRDAYPGVEGPSLAVQNHLECLLQL